LKGIFNEKRVGLKNGAKRGKIGFGFHIREKVMVDILKKFEKIIVMTLLTMMTFVVLLATIELVYILARDILTPPIIILEIEELLELFGLFLLVLIGIELLETVRAYLSQHVIHSHVVFTVALIAVGRKVIILDIYKIEGLVLIGIAAVIIALSVGYFLVRKIDTNP
jgi:uncharacterized membrane protein (DUF373 family)